MNDVFPISNGDAKQRNWPFFLTGILLFLLGPALYAIQVALKHLWTPWYVPVLATVGVLFIALSVWRKTSVPRIVGLAVFLCLCGGEWYLLGEATKTPLYTGPAQPGRAVPDFAASLADGTTFTNRDLKNSLPSVLVFFRGRW